MTLNRLTASERLELENLMRRRLRGRLTEKEQRWLRRLLKRAGTNQKRLLERDQEELRRRTVKVFRELYAALDSIDLDTIDGEFFFRCCQPEAAEILEFAKALDRTKVEDVQRFDDLLNELETHYHLPSDIARNAVLGGQRIRLRCPVITRKTDANLVDTSIEIHVYSGATRGSDLADLVTAEYSPSRNLGMWSSDPTQEYLDIGFQARILYANETGDRARRALKAGETYWEAVDDEDGGWTSIARDYVASPHIVLSIALPLPEPTAIAAIYDALCVNLRQWHKLLPGGDDQYLWTAMRTWTISLLKKSGMTHGQALGLWQDLANVQQTVTRQAHDEDMKSHLLKRVPEAAPFLTIRQKPYLTGR